MVVRPPRDVVPHPGGGFKPFPRRKAHHFKYEKDDVPPVITVLVVDDNDFMRAGLRSCLEPEPDIEVVGTASDGRSAVSLVGSRPVDVVLMDVSMPVLDGVEACRLITRSSPTTRVLMISAAGDLETVCDALDAGARGYLLKGDGPDRVAAGVRLVHAGGSVVAEGISRMLQLTSSERLSRRPGSGPG
jgi:DNA-binding NarL/FixJ family response regulator